MPSETDYLRFSDRVRLQLPATRPFLDTVEEAIDWIDADLSASVRLDFRVARDLLFEALNSRGAAEVAGAREALILALRAVGMLYGSERPRRGRMELTLVWQEAAWSADTETIRIPAATSEGEPVAVTVTLEALMRLEASAGRRVSAPPTAMVNNSCDRIEQIARRKVPQRWSRERACRADRLR